MTEQELKSIVRGREKGHLSVNEHGQNSLSVCMKLYAPYQTKMFGNYFKGENLAESSIIACVAALKKKGLLVRVGGRRQGYWGVRI